MDLSAMKNPICHWICFLILSTVGASHSFAEDMTLSSGRVLRNAKVLKAEPDGVKIMHDDGITKVPYDGLPAGLREKYNYNPAQAEAFKQKSQQDQIEAAKRIRKEREAIAEAQIAPIRAERERFAKTPRLTQAESIKGLWERSLPWPHGMETQTKLKFCQYMSAQIKSGAFDLEAESTAMQWNMQEYIRVGDTEKANELVARINATQANIVERDRNRQQAEYQERRLALQAAGMATAQNIANSLNTIAFKMMSGNSVIVNYW